MADEFISFDKVLRELQMQEEELKRLVSEGEIRAFRDQDKMKFKKEDVERFRKTRSSAKDDTVGGQEIPEELVFDEDDANQEVGMATAAIANDSFLEEEAPPAPDAAPSAKSAPRATRSAAAASTSRKPRVTIDEEEQTEGALWKVAVLASTVLLLLGILVALDATKASADSGITKNLAQMAHDMFFKNS